MDCERKGCGHPLAVHDPCSVPGCRCQAYEPADRKARAALLTDVDPDRRPSLGDLTKRAQRASLDELRAKELRRLGGLG